MSKIIFKYTDYKKTKDFELHIESRFFSLIEKYFQKHSTILFEIAQANINKPDEIQMSCSVNFGNNLVIRCRAKGPNADECFRSLLIRFDDRLENHISRIKKLQAIVNPSVNHHDLHEHVDAIGTHNLGSQTPNIKGRSEGMN
jgi:hypothetical protein